MDKNSSKQIGTAIENLLKTGRLITQTGLDLQQVSSFIHIFISDIQLCVWMSNVNLNHEIELLG